MERSGGGWRGVDAHYAELPRPSTSAEGTSEEWEKFAVFCLGVVLQLIAFLSGLLDDGLRFRLGFRRMGRGMTGLEKLQMFVAGRTELMTFGRVIRDAVARIGQRDE